MKNNTAGRRGWRVFGPPPRQSGAIKDEELVLFRELHKREKDRIVSLLLPVSEEFESFGSVNNHQASLFRIPSNKKSSLGLESLSGTDRNDFDWLKTPPATPLFPSLEMEVTTAPEMVVQRELTIMQPLSRFSSSSKQAPKQRQNQKDVNPKTLSTNKAKPSPTPIKTSTAPKPHKPTTNHIMPRHPNPFLQSNLSKPDPKPKPELSSTKRPTIRDSISPMTKRSSSVQTPVDKRSQPSNKRGITNGSGIAPGVKLLPDPRSRVVSSQAEKAKETTPLRSPRVKMGQGVTTSTMTRTTNKSSFFGSKIVDKVMNARKCGSGDVAGKTTERVGGFRKAGMNSSVGMVDKPTMESMGGLKRSSKITTSGK